MRLLLDAHISSRVAISLRASGHDVVTADEIGLKEESDHDLWLAAISQTRVMVTYDLDDFPVLYERFWHEGTHHPGLVLVSSQAIPQNDFGAQIRALARLLD